MLPETLKALSAHPPPKLSKLRFQKHAAAYAEIERLESALGILNSQPPPNIIEANNRVSQLTELAAKVAASLPAPATAKPTIGLAELTALSNLIFGQAETRNLLENSAAWQHGAQQMKEATATCESVRNKHGWYSPAATQSAIRRAELSERLKIERSGTDQDKLRRLAKSFVEAGLHVPGLSLKGMGIKMDLSAADQLTPNDRLAAQNLIVSFLRSISADANPIELTEQNPAARSARDFLSLQGRIDEDGRLTL